MPSSGDLPTPGIEPMSLTSPAVQVDSLPLVHLGSPEDMQMSQFSKGSKMFGT